MLYYIYSILSFLRYLYITSNIIFRCFFLHLSPGTLELWSLVHSSKDMPYSVHCTVIPRGCTASKACRRAVGTTYFLVKNK